MSQWGSKVSFDNGYLSTHRVCSSLTTYEKTGDPLMGKLNGRERIGDQWARVRSCVAGYTKRQLGG